jgi:hypothetical protein
MIQEMDSQLIHRVAIFNDGAHSVHNFFKLRTSSCRKSLGVSLLKEPKLLKCNDRIATGNLEVELENFVSNYSVRLG